MTPETRALSRYELGYARGWADIHESTFRRRRRTRTREGWEEYALGYEHGRADGGGHPDCPEWDDAHRVGSLHALPEQCPWNPVTATRTPDWSTIEGVVSIRAVRVRADALAVCRNTRHRPPEPGA